jgi:hypothetical protein
MFLYNFEGKHSKEKFYANNFENSTQHLTLVLFISTNSKIESILQFFPVSYFIYIPYNIEKIYAKY